MLARIIHEHLLHRPILLPGVAFSRMMKKAANFVLVSSTSSMYPRGYICGVGFACGLAGRPF
jgi:hypothetical protein